MEDFFVFSEPAKCYVQMLKDIENAKRYILLETYIYDSDSLGRRIRNALIKKAREGVKVKVLVDAWGSSAVRFFFKNLVRAGGEVRFFREFKYVIRIFSKNHERNHRKLLLIDGEKAYVGSLNIGMRFLNWRELMIRFVGPISQDFNKSFFQIWNSAGDFTRKRFKRLIHKGFEILQDSPSNLSKPVEQRFRTLIKFSKKSILIETPFFLVPRKIRHDLERAVKRGVKVIVILPKKSDVKPFDLLRDRYLGEIYRSGVKIYHYDNGKPDSNLHSKLLIVDDKVFIMGSSNLDYRSFVYQYEINVMGRDKDIISCLKSHFKETLEKSKPFNYAEWKSRSSLGKIISFFLDFFRYYF